MSRVTRADLRGFDGEATGLILEAQEAGARVKISRRNHAILMAPTGSTTAVPQSMKSNNRSAKNTRADVARLIKEMNR